MKISIKVSPRSSRNEIKKLPDGTYKIFLTAAPVDGKANDAAIKILSDHFSVSKSKIKILRGATGRNKIVEVQDS